VAILPADRASNNHCSVPTQHLCPTCQERVPLLDIDKSFPCPQCGTALAATGWGSLMIAQAVLCTTAGCLLIVLWLGLGWLGAVAMFLIWVALEVWVWRVFIKVGLAARHAT
jgi:hypothetical protein